MKELTKRRLSNILAYDWLKIAGLVLASIFLWYIIFQTAGTPASTGQTFGVFYYTSMNKTNDFLDHTIENEECLSDEILNYYSVMVDSNYSEYFLQTRSVTQDGDIMIVDNVPVASSVYPEQPQYAYSNFKSLVDTYSFFGYDELVASAKSYLAQCLNDGITADMAFLYYQPESVGFDKNAYFNGVFDTVKIYNLFNERTKGDRRFKNDAQKQEGREKEIKRIKTLFENTADLDYLLKNHPSMFVGYTKYEYRYYNAIQTNARQTEIDQYKAEYEAESAKRYALDTYYLIQNTNDQKLSATNFFSVTDQSGENNRPYVLVYDYLEYQPHTQFETISFVTKIVQKTSILLDDRR